MPRRIKSWMRPGQHWTPRKGEEGWRRWLVKEEYRKATEEGREAEPEPKPETEPEPEPEPETEPTVTTKVVDVAKATVTAPIKGAAAVGGVAIDATAAAASLPGKAGRAMKKAVMGGPEQEAPDEDIVEEAEKEINKVDEGLKPTKRDTNGRFRKPKKSPKEAPPETLEPPATPKIAGSIMSGYECNFCGKTYRLERYYRPHLDKCHLNPNNVGSL